MRESEEKNLPREAEKCAFGIREGEGEISSHLRFSRMRTPSCCPSSKGERRGRGDLHYGPLLLQRFHLRVEESHVIQMRGVGEGRRGRESERRRMTKPRTMSNIDWEAPTSFHTWRNRQNQPLPPPRSRGAWKTPTKKRRKQLLIRRGRPRARSGRITCGRRAPGEATWRLRGRRTQSLGEGRTSRQKFGGREGRFTGSSKHKTPLPPRGDCL